MNEIVATPKRDFRLYRESGNTVINNPYEIVANPEDPEKQSTQNAGGVQQGGATL